MGEAGQLTEVLGRLDRVQAVQRGVREGQVVGGAQGVAEPVREGGQRLGVDGACALDLVGVDVDPGDGGEAELAERERRAQPAPAAHLAQPQRLGRAGEGAQHPAVEVLLTADPVVGRRVGGADAAPVAEVDESAREGGGL